MTAIPPQQLPSPPSQDRQVAGAPDSAGERGSGEGIFTYSCRASKSSPCLRTIILSCAALVGIMDPTTLRAAESSVSIVIGSDAPKLEQFAAKELAGQLTTLFKAKTQIGSERSDSAGATILVGSPKTNPAISQAIGSKWPKLSDQGHVIRSVDKDGNSVLVVGGGSPVATLWAAYELGHHFGVRYTLHGDFYPENPGEMKLSGLDIVMEPAIAIRGWRAMDDLAIGPEAWGLAEQQKIIGQLAKLKFNRIVLPIRAWQPFLDYEFGGVRKSTGVLSRGHRYPIDGDSGGRAAFGGAIEFANPDLAKAKTDVERTAAGIKLLQGIIDAAHDKGMSAGISLDPMEFPKEFAALVPGAKPVAGLEGLAVTPAGKESSSNDRLLGLAKAQLRACLDTYPTIDFLSLDLQDSTAGTEKLTSALAAIDKRVNAGKSGGIDPVGIKLMPDDFGVLPGMATSAVHESLQSIVKDKGAGYVARCRAIGDLGPCVYYLSRASFDPALTPAKALDDLITPACGEEVAPRVAKAFAMTEKATSLIRMNDPTLAFPAPGMLLKQYESSEPPPAWWKEVADLYLEAMNEMFRANTRSRQEGRAITLYFAKKFEFGLQYMTGLQAIRLAGAAKSKKEAEEQVTQLEQAVEAIYGALDVYREVARDSGDRGIIAVINEYGYRPLKAEFEARAEDSESN